MRWYGLLRKIDRELWPCLSLKGFSSVQSLSHVRLFETPQTTARQASRPSPTPGVHPNSCPLSWWCHPTISSSASPSPPALYLSQHQGLFKWVSSSHEWPTYWSFSFNISPFNEHPGLISFRMDWLDLLAVQGTLSRVFSNTIVQKHQFFGAQPSSQSNSHIHTQPLEKP